jgi:hypothetical protein
MVRDRLLDDEPAALPAAVGELAQRLLDVAAAVQHPVEHDRVLERDRGAGGERGRRGVDRVPDEHGAPVVPGRRHEDGLDRAAHDLLGVGDAVAHLPGQAAEAREQLAHQGGLVLGRHARELGLRLDREHVHLRVGDRAQPACRAPRVVEVELVDLGRALEQRAPHDDAGVAGCGVARDRELADARADAVGADDDVVARARAVRQLHFRAVEPAPSCRVAPPRRTPRRRPAGSCAGASAGRRACRGTRARPRGGRSDSARCVLVASW